MKKTLGVLFIALLICSIAACGNNENLDNSDNSDSQVTSSSSINNQEETKMSTEEREALEKLLEDNGIDTSILDEAADTELGGTILGDAKPVKQFKTLHDGEEYYKSYLGFHNSIDSLPGYNLVGLYCVNDEFMQAIYESEQGESNLVVKFSKTLNSGELREPYDISEYIKHLDIKESVSAHLEGEDKSSINLILLDYTNGKSYSIYSKQGLSEEIAADIANELTDNVMSMTDWK